MVERCRESHRRSTERRGVKPILCHYVFEDGSLCRNEMTHKVDKVNVCNDHYADVVKYPQIYQRCEYALWRRKRGLRISPKPKAGK